MSRVDEISANLEKVKHLDIPLTFIENHSQLSVIQIPKGSVIIDALFGIGINKPLEGLAAELVQKMNEADELKIAVDLPDFFYRVFFFVGHNLKMKTML